jgi:hypothetical protein
MQQVADWLEKLGLGQYAQRFAENDISFSVLPDLTDQDLKDIGVSLGHRRQLLREIANLEKMAAASPSAPSLTPPHATQQPILAEESHIADEEGWTAEGAAGNARFRVLERAVLDRGLCVRASRA